MILIVGLGNPGKKFQKTRHNSGWLALDLLQKKLEKKSDFSSWKESKKLKAEISKGKINNETIILAKPLTFMNLSGQAVKAVSSFYKIQPNNLFVIHDDIDISLGKIKVARNRGAAGHKGIQSIISELGEKKFNRLRIGIKPWNIKPKNTEKFVLLEFNEKEKVIIKKAAEKSAQAIEMIINEGIDKVMNEFNKKKPEVNI